MNLKTYRRIMICFTVLSCLAFFDLTAADYQTPRSSIMCVIRPWPEMDNRPESEEAMDRWSRDAFKMSNGNELDLNPYVTISRVLDNAYRCAGAAEISTHGNSEGHSIEVYPYTEDGEDACNASYDNISWLYGNLIWKDEITDEGYFIAIRYSELPSWINSATGTMADAIFHNECCYGEDGSDAFQSCGAAAFYGPPGEVTIYEGERNVEKLWNNLGMSWDERKDYDEYSTGTAYQDCPHLCFHGTENSVLGPAIRSCSQNAGAEVPAEGLDVEIVLDTEIETDLCDAINAVSVSGDIVLESAAWVGNDGIRATVKPGTENGNNGGTVNFLANMITSGECPSLYMNCGEDYSIALNNDGDYAATSHAFYVTGGLAHWRVTSEYKTIGYRIEGAYSHKGPWNEISTVDAGVGCRSADVSSSNFTLYRLVEIEEDGREIINGIVKAGHREITKGIDLPAASELKARLTSVAEMRNERKNPEVKSSGMGAGEKYVIFTVDSLSDVVETYVADYWESFGYSVYLRTVDGYPADPDSFCAALKDTISSFADAGAIYFHLIGDANDCQQFSSPWSGEWEQIRQDFIACGYPPGGQPENNLIPTWSFADTLPRLQNTSYFTPYTLTDKPYSDTDSDGIPDVVVTRWPVTTIQEVLSLSLKMQSYMDWGLPSVSSYSVLTCVGDLDHMASGDGMYVSRVTDSVIAALPAGQDKSFIYESDYIIDCERNDATAALWNSVEPELVLISSSYSNRSWPGNFFVRVGTSNPFHMGMLEEGFPVVIFGFTCDTGDYARTEDPYYGKPVFHRFLVEQDKGAIAWIGPSLGSWERGNMMIGKYFVEELFNDLDRPVAESFLIAQQRVHQDFPYDSGLLRTVDMYSFLGHPLLRLHGKSIITYAEMEESPEVTLLAQNYPNPFNPSTTIKFSIPYECHVELVIYDVQGRRIKVLVDKELTSGRHVVRWNGRNESGERVASGLYFYRLRSGDKSITRKMVLIK